ncbi:MAG: hypothetical protein AAGF23_20780, partial [Acidobacteriota bacterium]
VGPLTLVIEETKAVRGEVVLDGTATRGALVLAQVLSPGGAVIANREGRWDPRAPFFTVEVPEASAGADLLISAAGAAVRLQRVTWPGDNQRLDLQVRSASQGGRIAFELPDASSGSNEDLDRVRGLFLRGPQGQIAVAELVARLDVEFVPPGSIRVRPPFEPGLYGLCVTTAECVEGYLAPAQDLVFEGARLPSLKPLFGNESP